MSPLPCRLHLETFFSSSCNPKPQANNVKWAGRTLWQLGKFSVNLSFHTSAASYNENCTLYQWLTEFVETCLGGSRKVGDNQGSNTSHSFLYNSERHEIHVVDQGLWTDEHGWRMAVKLLHIERLRHLLTFSLWSSLSERFQGWGVEIVVRK